MKSGELKKFYDMLYNFFGPQHWWPAKTKFEICVGAILTQNTSWRNVEKAIARLREAKKLSVHGISSLSTKELAELIKSAGYYNQKAMRLKAFCKHLEKNYKGSLRRFLAKPKQVLRNELLSMHGIGPETADCIILYAAEKPSFVVDAYTERIAARAWNLNLGSRDALKAFFEKNLPKDAKLYNEYHALLVALGKNFCRKRPLCPECPINKKCYYYKNKIKTHENS